MAIELFVKQIESLQLRQQYHHDHSLTTTAKFSHNSTLARCHSLSEDLVKLKDLLQSAANELQTSK